MKTILRMIYHFERGYIMQCSCGSREFDLIDKVFSNGSKHKERKCSNCGKHNGYQQTVKTEDFILPFGKYKGQKILDIARHDIGYINFLAQIDKPSIANRAKELLK